jgi:hypothetical protein
MIPYTPLRHTYRVRGRTDPLEVVGGRMPDVVGGTWGGYLGDESIDAVCNMIVDHSKCILSIERLLVLLGTWHDIPPETTISYPLWSVRRSGVWRRRGV